MTKRSLPSGPAALMVPYISDADKAMAAFRSGRIEAPVFHAPASRISWFGATASRPEITTVRFSGFSDNRFVPIPVFEFRALLARHGYCVPAMEDLLAGKSAQKAPPRPDPVLKPL
jgi:hypothetical protein